jgi:prepilin-type N-terminal cleavage/methylation domain-containing protein
MLTQASRRRAGFTMAEIVVALVIVGIVGTALTKLLTSQMRFFDGQTNLKAARSVARTAMNVVLADLRMVQDSGGVDSVTSDGKLIRIIVPYRFGLVCASTGSGSTVSMLPVDSGTIAVSAYAGYAWRVSATGRYAVVTPPDPTNTDIPTNGSASTCTGSGSGQAQIQTVSANGRSGHVLRVTPAAPAAAFAGTPIFFWQHITYSFRTSAAYDNALGLWRNVQGGKDEEIMAPFDTSSRFRFYLAGEDSSRLAAPAVSEIRGVDLVLSALSPKADASRKVASQRQSTIVTSAFFKNVRKY